jgi:hypothetical protein
MIKKAIINLLLILIIGCIVDTGLSAESQILNARSFKQKSMGGASIALSHDDTALYNNPAGLYLAKFRVKLPRFGMHVNSDIYENLQEIDDLLNNHKNNKNKQRTILKGLPSQTVGIKYSLLPVASWTWRGIGVAVMAEGTLNGEFKNYGSTQELRLYGYNDVVPAFGVAQEFDLWGRTLIGVSGKYLTRSIIYDKKTGEDELKQNTDDIIDLINGEGQDSEGLERYTVEGMGIDVGMLREVDSKWLGKGYWGITIRNMGMSLSGEKRIVSNKVINVTDDIPITVGVGIGTTIDTFPETPVISWLVGDLDIAADFYIKSPHSKIVDNIKLGIEQKLLWNILKLRAGINAGHFVGGGGLDIKLWKIPLLHINYAYYIDEVNKTLDNNFQSFHAVELGILF